MFDFSEKRVKWGRRRAPGRGNILSGNYWGWPWHGDPFEKKDGAKILIFYDFRFSRQNDPKSAPNDGPGPEMVRNDY